MRFLKLNESIFVKMLVILKNGVILKVISRQRKKAEDPLFM